MSTPHVHQSVAASIRGDLQKHIPDGVTRVVRFTLPQTLNAVVPLALARLLPSYLADALATTLTHTLTRSVTHSLAYTLQHTLATNPAIETV